MFRIGGLLLLLLLCLGPHLVAKALRLPSRWPRRFLGAAAYLTGARVEVVGQSPQPRTLLVANHISWLDILILAGATDCAFVSKDDLGHPIAHWLADQNGTLYVNRAARGQAADQVQAIRQRLYGQQPLAVFPEGTVGPGDHLLPFRSTLLAAVAPAPDGVTVQPVALDYGSAAVELSWAGEQAIQNALRIFGRRGSFPVVVRLLEPLAASPDRKHLAGLAQNRIAAALGASSSAGTRL